MSEKEQASLALADAAFDAMAEALDRLQDKSSALVGAVLSRDSRAMLLAANEVNTLIPTTRKMLRLYREGK